MLRLASRVVGGRRRSASLEWSSPADPLLDRESEAFLSVRNFLALPATGVNSQADVIAYLKTL